MLQPKGRYNLGEDQRRPVQTRTNHNKRTSGQKRNDRRRAYRSQKTERRWRAVNIGKITVIEAAKILHVSDQFVRIGLQRNVLPIGTALKMSSKWTYQISPAQLATYSGADVAAELAKIRAGA